MRLLVDRPSILMPSVTMVFVMLMLEGVNEVNGRRKWGNEMADAAMDGWAEFLRASRGPSYRYWHSRKDAEGRWHRRKYGHSDSGSASSEDSKSRSRESDEHHRRHRGGRRRSHNRHSTSDSGSSSKETRTSKLPATMAINKTSEEDKPLAAQAFLFYVGSFGCSNTTSFLGFIAAYSSAAGDHDEEIDEGQNDLMNEISNLAKGELSSNKSPH